MLDEAMRQLCQTSKTFLGIIAMLCIILSAILYAANYFVNSGKPKTSKKPLLWLASVTVFMLSVLSIAIYIVLPPIAASLLGPGDPNDPCSPAYQPNYTKPLPFCGDYCDNQSIPKDYQDCTCQHLAIIQE